MQAPIKSSDVSFSSETDDENMSDAASAQSLHLSESPIKGADSDVTKQLQKSEYIEQQETEGEINIFFFQKFIPEEFEVFSCQCRRYQVMTKRTVQLHDASRAKYEQRFC